MPSARVYAPGTSGRGAAWPCPSASGSSACPPGRAASSTSAPRARPHRRPAHTCSGSGSGSGSD
eukprot:scaffold86302_cov60-Phaeocystis_antarctica.AAC.5